MDEVTVQGQIFVNTIMNLWDPQKSANFLTCWPNTNFWGTNTWSSIGQSVFLLLLICCQQQNTLLSTWTGLIPVLN